jgi:NADPH:quinone reductase-like Zn-dependent oxidoreductase
MLPRYAIDWKARAGYVKDVFPASPALHSQLGFRIVEAIGPGLTQFKKGDEVYAVSDGARSGKSTYVALTAWQALFDRARLSIGQKVLIHGAAGGVGSVAVQLAKWKGAHVIGTAMGRNQGLLRELGVDEPIDYEKTRFEDLVHDVDVVLDTLAGDAQNRSWKVLKKGGILVSVVAPPPAEEAAKHSVRSAFLAGHPSSAQLSEIAKLVDAGKLKPVVETVLPLSDARRAHELNETGHARGKTVLKVA